MNCSIPTYESHGTCVPMSELLTFYTPLINLMTFFCTSSVFITIEMMFFIIWKSSKIPNSYEMRLISILFLISAVQCIDYLNYYGFRFRNFCYFWSAINQIRAGLCVIGAFFFISQSTSYHTTLRKIQRVLYLIMTFNLLFGSVTHAFVYNYCYEIVPRVYYTLAGILMFIWTVCDVFLGIFSGIVIYRWKSKRQRFTSTIVVLIVFIFVAIISVISTATNGYTLLHTTGGGFSTSTSTTFQPSSFHLFAVFSPVDIMIPISVLLITFSMMIRELKSVYSRQNR